MKADQTDIQNLVLSLAVEDYFGLYEVIWAMNEQWPGLEEAKKMQLATDAVMVLLQSELIQLYKIELQGNKPELIPSQQTYSFVHSHDSWQPGDSYIGFAATAEGENTYFTTGSKNA